MEIYNSGFLRGSGLKYLAAQKGLKFGCAMGEPENDRILARAIVSDCNIITGEYQMKWDTLRPTSLDFDFSAADRLVNFAIDNGIAVRGHTLVWHDALPAWFGTTVNSANAEEFLTNHINTVVGRYAGKIHSWDVINEAISGIDGNPTLRDSPWSILLGADYIKIAFEAARNADPAALLAYNDYGLDYSFDEGHRTAILAFLEGLLDDDIPIDALGIQAHLDAAAVDQFAPSLLRSFLGDVASLGLKIMITELDVIDRSLPQNVVERDHLVGQFYGKYLECVLEEPAVISVQTWGLSDRYTWIGDYAPRNDGASVRPLPLDRYMLRKPSWEAIAESLTRR